MQLTLSDIGRRYNKEWIFQHVNLTLSANNCYAILGGNGSGKSTLLQVIAGNFMPSEGTITYLLNDKIIEQEKVYQYISLASPYMSLLEEFTVTEHIDLHFKLKKAKGNLTTNAIIELLNFQSNKNKMVRHFSSGMKQRLKLGLAILADSPILLLDEPISNLDKANINWYKEMLQAYKKDRLILIASNNIADEIFLCNETIDVVSYKKVPQ